MRPLRFTLSHSGKLEAVLGRTTSTRKTFNMNNLGRFVGEEWKKDSLALLASLFAPCSSFRFNAVER
jgi:hypothetical protein